MSSFGVRFGKLVRKTRESQGITATELADQAFEDVSKRSRISELENGKIKRPQADTISALSAVLGFTPEQIEACRRPNTNLDKKDRMIQTLTNQLEEAQRTINRLRAQGDDADPNELIQSQTRVSELERRLQNPDAALAEARETIKKLNEALRLEGNVIGEARMAEARAALEDGDFTLADDIFAEIAAREDLAVKRTARAAFARGEIAEQDVRWADAAEHYVRAAELHGTADHMMQAKTFLQRSGDYPAAQYWGEKMLPAVIAEHGDGTPEHATALNNLAFLYKARGKYDAAEPLYMQAIEIGKSTLGEAHPDYATRLNNLARLFKARGKYDAAEPLYMQAMKITKATLGETHADYAIRLNNLAVLYRAQGKYDAAEPLYLQAMKITKATLGETHPSYATRLKNLAELYRAQGKYDAAEPLFLKAIEIGKSTLGEAHPNYAISLNNLAGLYSAQGKYDAAEPLFVQAIAVFEAALGADHPDTKTVRKNYEDFLAEKPD